MMAGGGVEDGWRWCRGWLEVVWRMAGGGVEDGWRWCGGWLLKIYCHILRSRQMENLYIFWGVHCAVKELYILPGTETRQLFCCAFVTLKKISSYLK